MKYLHSAGHFVLKQQAILVFLAILALVAGCTEPKEKVHPVAAATDVTPQDDEVILFYNNQGPKSTTGLIKIKSSMDISPLGGNSASATTTITGLDNTIYKDTVLGTGLYLKTTYGLIKYDSVADTRLTNNGIRYYGHKWSYTNPDPHLSDSATGGRTLFKGPLRVAGPYTSVLKYLMPNTNYYVQPYVVNYGKPWIDRGANSAPVPTDSGQIAYGPAQKFTSGPEAVFPVAFAGFNGNVIFSETFQKPIKISGLYQNYHYKNNIWRHGLKYDPVAQYGTKPSKPADSLSYSDSLVFISYIDSTTTSNGGYYVKVLANTLGFTTLFSPGITGVLNPDKNFEITIDAIIRSDKGSLGFEWGDSINTGDVIGAKSLKYYKNNFDWGYDSRTKTGQVSIYQTQVTKTNGTKFDNDSPRIGAYYTTGCSALKEKDLNTITIRKYDGWYFFFVNGTLINLRQAYNLDSFGGYFALRVNNKSDVVFKRIEFKQQP